MIFTLNLEETHLYDFNMLFKLQVGVSLAFVIHESANPHIGKWPHFIMESTHFLDEPWCSLY
jgi:hypothetical protein